MYARLSMGMMLVFLAVSAVQGQGYRGGPFGLPTNYVLPPAERLMEPGPGVGGPGPGVIPPSAPFGIPLAPPPTVQILFGKPDALQVRWDVSGVGHFDSTPLIVPGRRNFPQGGVYGLKLTNIGGREGVELYPTLEIGPMTTRTAAYLAHNAIPIQFTEEDFDQVLSGNFVTKVIYLPDPEFQELALADVDTLVSTRLDPGVDPIAEADRRGAILAIVRLGNKDMEMPSDDGFRGADGGFEAAGYNAGGYGAPVYNGYAAMPYVTSPGAMPNYVSGVNGPQYGMPISGTPIGLPGPPHVPLGGPAGLQKHVMRNHTHQYIPGPTDRLNVAVKQKPGLAYPAPADKVYVRETTVTPRVNNFQPPADMLYINGDPGAYGNDPATDNCNCPACQQRRAQR